MVQGLRRLRARFDAVLLDLDGTLLDGNAELTPRTVRAVHALVAAGFQVLLCTGRSVAGTKPHHAALGLDTPLVSYNGSWIGHPDGDAPDHYLPIPDLHVDAVLEAERDAHFSFRHRAETKYTVMTEHPEHHAVADWFENVVRAEAHHELPAVDLMRVSLFFDERVAPTDDVRRRMWGGMAEHARRALRLEVFPLRIFPSYEDSSLVLFEVQGHSRGKAEALDWLDRARGIPHSRTIAVGDHMNDLTMLDAAGLAVTPANGIPEARARAHLVIGHHAEEGVAAWIEQGAPCEPRAGDGVPGD